MYPKRRAILRDGVPIHAEPRLFDLLVFLADAGGEVVSKADIVHRVWKGRAISDDAITSAVRDLRALLGDNGRSQNVVRTVYGAGLSLVAPITWLEAISDANADTNLFQEKQVLDEIPKPLRERPAIAVLPLQPMQDDDLALCRAATLDLTVALARTRWLFVTSHGSASQVTDTAIQEHEIVRRLGVRYLLKGTLVRDARRIRLSVLLTDTIDGRDVWGQTLARPLDDVGMAIDEVAHVVAAGIEAEIALRERRRALVTPMANLDAWSAYHRAMALLLRFSKEQFDPAEALLERAASLEPANARIRAGLSFLNWQRAFLEHGAARSDAHHRAIEHARESISLDAGDPQGHWALGRAHIIDMQVDRAETFLSRAVALNPSFANAHYSMAWSLSQEPSRRADSQRIVDNALMLSPEDPMVYGFHILEADLAYFRGEYEHAIKKALQAASHPWAHHHVLAIGSWVLEASGASDHARAFAAEVRRRKPGYSFSDYSNAVPLKGDKRIMVREIFHRLGY